LDTFQELNDIIQPLLDELGVELVELQYNKGKSSSVRIFIWEEGGVSLDRCTAISRRISDMLDRKDIISGKYFLEVSSPGLDRPLEVKRDFERQIGRMIKATIRPNDKTKEIEGKIESVDDDGVSIKMDQGVEHTPFNEIVSAKIIAEF